MKFNDKSKRTGQALLVFLFSIIFLAACSSERRVSFSGKTMGTVYHITVIAPAGTRVSRLQKKVDTRLVEINNSLSTYVPTSEISRFNALTDAGRPFVASMDFVNVLRVGQKVYALTDGAWDATVWPLVKLWGFNRSGPPSRLPDPKQIEAALSCVGFDNIRLTAEGTIIKKKGCVTLDLGSIAKGYGVDQVAALLKENGITDFIVEIGGEIVASGTKQNGADWNVGINLPDAHAPVDQVRRVLTLSNRAVATSGDYRNYFTVDDQAYCHVFDPRCGRPVTTRVVSASVVSDTCTFADGLATALMVMSPEKGLALVDSLENTECLITVRGKDGQLQDYYSRHFQ